jgi:hypothetical protein
MGKFEVWMDIPGYEGLYQVSNFGIVKSLPKSNHNGKILKPSNNNKGYLFVRLYYKSKPKVYYLQQIVAMAFLNHIIDGHNIVVDHIDGNPFNNNLNNLQLITQRGNASKAKYKKTSKYTGVCWDKHRNKWISSIQINGSSIYLGRFEVDKKASQMYQLALKNIHLYNGNNEEFIDILNNQLNNL